MSFLYSNPEIVEKLTGLSLKGSMLTTTQYHDRRHVLPFVLESDKSRYLLVRQIEDGNMAATGFTAMPQLRFSAYFFPGKTADVHASVAKAVLSVTGKGAVTVDARTPVSVYTELKGATAVSVKQDVAVPVEAYKLDKTQILSKFNHHRADVIRACNDITKGHPDYDRLNALYDAKPDGTFDLLDGKASAKGIGAMLASWVTDFQELTGLKGTLSEDFGYAALYLVGKGETWVIAPKGSTCKCTASARCFGSLAEAVAELAEGAVIGFEEDTLGAAHYVEMLEKGASLKEAGGVFKDWRDEKVKFDVPYFVLAAMATRYAMEGAASFAGLAIGANVPVTERDVDSVFRSKLEEFAQINKLQVELKFYFVNTHAGSRTIYPSRPSDYVLGKGINSLKLDSGVFVFDDGLYHACSDIARTVTTTSAADEVFDAMEKVMLEQTIPGIKPGMAGEQIHSMGVGQMAAQSPIFQKNAYMPATFSWRDGYPRDIGHVLERQETNSFLFKPGSSRKVEAGMVGCIEFHCAYDGHSMASEDSFVLDDTGAIIISRGPEEFGKDGLVTRRRRANRP